MSQSSSNFQRRKSVADFLSENMPNRILYATVKDNTKIPDELILKAFNDAYAHCLEVLSSPELHTRRSETYATMTDGITRSTLLSLAFSYFLLSFHQEALRLGRYLSNLKDLLEKRMPDIFRPILIATSMASLIPGTSSFGYPVAGTISPPVFEPRQFVSMQRVMDKAEELPKEECLIVLETLNDAVIEASGDWNRIIGHRIDAIAKRKEPSMLQSKYRIADRRISDFVVVMRICAELRIFEEIDGFILRNFEKFAIAFGSFFNIDVKDPNNLFSQAKDRKKFLKIFDDMKEAAIKILENGDSPDEQRQKQTSRKKPQAYEPEIF